MPAAERAEEHRLAHRLGVHELVAQHQLVQLARPVALEHVERPLAHGVEVLERVVAVEQLDVAARARGVSNAS